MAVLARPLRRLRSGSLAGPLVALAAIIGLLYYGRVLLITLATAVILAFILEPLVGLLMRIHLPRTLASFLVCSVALLFVYLLLLGIYTQASGLTEDVPKYADRINELAEQVLGKIESMERSAYELVVPKRFREVQQPAPTPPQPKTRSTRRARRTPEPPMPAPPPQVQEVRIRPERPPLLDFAYAHLGPVYETVLMASFVPFLVYFMLSWRDHLHRSFLLLFEEQGRMMASRSLNGIASMARAFVAGNFLLGVLLTIFSTVVFWLFRLPYPLLIGPLSGFLSLIPYIGLPLSILPPFVAALTIYRTATAYLVIGTVVAVLHLVGLNLLYPKIVGPRVHLNPLVVTVALMFWATLWGAAGLVLAIPLTAGLKAVCDNVDRLKPYGKLLGD